jgi:hypothetical protein
MSAAGTLTRDLLGCRGLSPPCDALRDAIRLELEAVTVEPAPAWTSTPAPVAVEVRTVPPSPWCLTDSTACGRYGRCRLTRHLEDHQRSTAPRWTRGGST